MQVFTSVIVLGLCFAAFVVSHINDYKQRKAEAMVSLAQLIGSSSASAIQFEDSEAAIETLSGLKKVSPDVLNAAILDKHNKVFATYVKPGQDTFLFKLANPGSTKVDYISKYLFVYSSIIDKGEILGTVCLRIELKELAQIKAKQYKIALVILVIGVGLAFLISFIVQSYISKRLLNLVKIMNHVSETGDYTKHVNTDGKDEISTLSHVFNNLMDQVRISQEKKDEFIGIASHELKTPLTSIKGYLQVLDDIEERQPNKKYIQKTLGSVNRLQDLIFDLLDVSKIQSGQLHLNFTDFDIDPLIDETIATFQVIAPDHKITRRGKNISSIVSADKQRIEQVLINLLSNAVKYSPNAKEVFVYTEKTNRDFIIKVRDFGIGIAKGEQSRVFDRFYRAKDNSILISGFGLGLYICKDIMKKHKGKIWVESDGTGTVFNISLPVPRREIIES
ncbi:MAG: ATP-binding protein [Bacteroidota bacterium]|nr:ATP-binding protein [Bacteroidota bacterium]